jgi:phosphate-selective porin OprO and OprP
MRINSGNRVFCSTALVALCAALIPVAAHAQDAATDRIDKIEKQIRNLQSELQELKGELSRAKKQLRQSQSEVQRSKDQARQAQQAAQQAQQQAQQEAASAATAQSRAAQAAAQAAAAAAAAPPAAAAPKVAGATLSMPGGRPTITSSDGRAVFAIGTQTQLDMGGYFQHPSDTTQFPVLNSGLILRRGRIFFVGQYDDFVLRVTPDFKDPSPTLYEANLNYVGIKPIVGTVGYFKPWYTMYDSQSSNDFLLLERPTVIDISRNLAAGDSRASAGFKFANDRFFYSTYLTGAAYGQYSTSLNGEQLGIAGRIAGRPYHDKDWNVAVNFSAEDVFHPNLMKGGTPFVSQETLTFQNQPELRIDQNNLISTGALSSTSANSFGGEIGINWRNYLVQGGYYTINVNQLLPPSQPSPVLSFGGGYVEGGWVITGEPIRYSVGDAAFARPVVINPFSLGGGIGAWELGARYSVMNLNSHVIDGVPQSVTGGVYGGFQQVYGVALSWYPNNWLRLMLQFQYVNVNKLDPTGTVQIGQRFETLAGRVQVAF